MKYILTKDDLLDLKYEVPSVKIFLKSKQPVKEIASGEVFANGELYETFAEVGAYHLGEELEKYNGKNIKIYVEVI